MYGLLLASHIAIGIATGGAGAYSLVTIYNGWSPRFRHAAIALGLLATIEIVTGTMLAVLSLQISAAAVCERIALYLALVFMIEALLFIRMKQISLVRPFVTVFSPMIAALTALMGAVAAGF